MTAGRKARVNAVVRALVRRGYALATSNGLVVTGMPGVTFKVAQGRQEPMRAFMRNNPTEEHEYLVFFKPTSTGMSSGYVILPLVEALNLLGESHPPRKD